MTIHELLQHSPEIIHRRAEKILEEKNLFNLRRENNKISSTVRDGLDYEQTLYLKGKDVSSYQCTCHEGTALCSHLVTLLLRLDKKSLASFSPRKKPKAYLSQEKDDLKELLQAADKEDLVAFILSLRSSYRDMPVLIRKNFMTLDGEEYLKESHDMLEQSYKTLENQGHKDFSSHSAALLKVHEKARQEARQRNYVGASLLYLLLFEMVSRETFSMEAYLFHSQYIKVYEEALQALSEKKYTGAESFMLFEYLYKSSRKLKNLSEVSTLMKIMKNFMTTEKDFDWFYEILLELVAQGNLPPLEKNNLLFLEYELLMMVNKEDEAQGLRRENPEVFEFLMMETKLLLENGEYQKALQLCDEQITKEDRNWITKIQWLYQKARILKKLHHHEALLDVTISLLALGEYKAYPALKKTIEDASWPAFYQAITENSDVRANTKGVYLRILLEEKDKEKLLVYTRDHRKSIVEHYELLHPEYGDEASAHLTAFIMDEARKIKERKDYTPILSLIEKLYIYGHEKQASDTIMALVMNDKYKTSFHTALFALKDTYAKDSPYEEEKF